MSMGRRPMQLSHSRVYAVRREIEARRESARLASRQATDERQRAALRGKFHAYGESLHMLDALDNGRILTRLFRTPKRRRPNPWDRVTALAEHVADEMEASPLVVGGFPKPEKESSE